MIRKLSCIKSVIGSLFILGLCFLNCSYSALKNEKQSERFKSPSNFFKQEYERIIHRREIKRLSTQSINGKPKNLIGIALSGGGIRSNAFQLGVLSGLNKQNVVNRLDYMSAVSGGSWAAGAYKFKGMPDSAFFRVIDDEIKSDTKKTLNMPDDYEKEVSYSLFSFLILQKWAWTNKMQKIILNNKNISFDELEDSTPDLPYLIINATYNSSGVFNFPMETRLEATLFEFTSDCSGMCYNNENKYYNTKDMRISNWFVKKEKVDFARVLGVSSAVINSWWFGFARYFYEPLNTVNENDYEKIRLSDGGHSENFGALALLERRADLIIISDAGQDENYYFSDLAVFIKRAENKFGVTFNVGNTRLIPVTTQENTIAFANENGGLILSSFSHDNHTQVLEIDVLKDSKKISKVLYLKPRLTSAFIEWLDKKIGGYDKIYQYILDNTKHFPQDNTIEKSYNKYQIRAYYLLGKFIGEKNLSPQVQAWISKHR